MTADTVLDPTVPPRLGRNAAANIAFDVTSALAGLLLTPLLIDRLGTVAFGVWALAWTVIGYLELFEFGFGRATVKLVAEHSGRRPEAVVRTVNTNLFVLAVFGLVALAVGVVVAVFAPAWFSVPASLRGETIAVFALLAVSLAASVPLDTFGAALAGHQRYDLLSSANIVSVLLSTAVSIAVLLAGGGLVALAVWNLAVLLGMQIVRWRLLRRVAPGMRLSPSLVDRAAVRPTARLSGWFLVRDVARVAIHRVDLVVVGVVLGVRAAAIYAVAGKLATLARRFITSVARLYFPFASSVAARDDRRALGGVVVAGSRTVLLVGAPIAIVLAFLGRAGIEAWVGAGFGDAVSVLVILAAAQVLFALTEPWWSALMGAGRVRLVATVAIAEAVLNVILSVILAHSLGIDGVALGTLLAITLFEVPVGLVLIGREVGVPLRAVWTGAVRPHVIPAAVAGAAAAGLAQVVPAHAVPVAGAGVVTIAVYLLAFAVLSATPTERSGASTRIRSLLRWSPTSPFGRATG